MFKVYLLKKNKKKKISVCNKSTTILDLARRENLNIEGSCDGSMACSTCHVLIEKEWFVKLPPPCLDEKEMLTLLPNYNSNSRLGCQILITKKLDGLSFSIPEDEL